MLDYKSVRFIWCVGSCSTSIDSKPHVLGFFHPTDIGMGCEIQRLTSPDSHMTSGCSGYIEYAFISWPRVVRSHLLIYSFIHAAVFSWMAA